VSKALTKTEASELARCEDIVKDKLSSFLESADALQTIWDKKLYRATHKNFESYLLKKWGFRRSPAPKSYTELQILEFPTCPSCQRDKCTMCKGRGYIPHFYWTRYEFNETNEKESKLCTESS
jgi:hypothetical protein